MRVHEDFESAATQLWQAQRALKHALRLWLSAFAVSPAAVQTDVDHVWCRFAVCH